MSTNWSWARSAPLVVVPEETLPRPRPHRGLPLHSGRAMPVVLGVGPATEPEVIEFAFAEAQNRRAGLVAVRTWNDPLVDLGLLLPAGITRWDTADERVRGDLARQLGPCSLAHPGVEVEQLVVNDGCAELLAAVALDARLLVLGRPARGALLDGVTASPAVTLARNVPCPVVIVPPVPGVASMTIAELDHAGPAPVTSAEGTPR